MLFRRQVGTLLAALCLLAAATCLAQDNVDPASGTTGFVSPTDNQPPPDNTGQPPMPDPPPANPAPTEPFPTDATPAVDCLAQPISPPAGGPILSILFWVVVLLLVAVLGYAAYIRFFTYAAPISSKSETHRYKDDWQNISMAPQWEYAETRLNTRIDQLQKQVGEANARIDKYHEVFKKHHDTLQELDKRLQQASAECEKFLTEDALTRHDFATQVFVVQMEQNLKARCDALETNHKEEAEAWRGRLDATEKELQAVKHDLHEWAAVQIQEKITRAAACLDEVDRRLAAQLPPEPAANVLQGNLKKLDDLLRDIKARVETSPECKKAEPEVTRLCDALVTEERGRLRQLFAQKAKCDELRKQLEPIRGEVSNDALLCAINLAAEADLLRKHTGEGAPVRIDGLWTAVENQLMDALEPYFLEKYRLHERLEPYDPVVRNLQSLTIEPMTIILRETAYKPERHNADGNRNVAGVRPGAIVQVLTQGYCRVGAGDVLRKAHVVTQSE